MSQILVNRRPVRPLRKSPNTFSIGVSMLKKILAVLVVVIIAVLAYAGTRPDSFTVER